mgnify:CR=1 FL=1
MERASGLKCGEDFFLGYSPERINPGDKIHTVDRVTKIVAGQTPEIADFLAMVYGEADAGPSGPVATGASRDGETIRIAFEGVEEGLMTVSADTGIGLELCDAGTCHFAPAALDGEGLVIKAGDAPISQIRYCQGAAPLCNLFDGNSLPAGPFWMDVN